MERAQPVFPTDRLLVEPWPDPLVERLGFDPRSVYVETFWLGVLGPSTVWLLRRLVSRLEESPEGYTLDLVECAASLGLGNKGGRHGPFARSLVRACQFGMARPGGPGSIQVRRKLPPLSRGHVMRLPEALREAHERWQAEAASPRTRSFERSRVDELAGTLVRAGGNLDLVERRLVDWGVPAPVAAEAAAQAWERERATAAAGAGVSPS